MAHGKKPPFFAKKGAPAGAKRPNPFAKGDKKASMPMKGKMKKDC